MRPKQAALEPGGGPGSPDPALPLNHKIFYHSCSVQGFKLDHFINWWRQSFSSEWVDNWKNQVNSFPYITLLIIDYFPVIVSFTFSSLDKFVISSWHNSPQQAKLPMVQKQRRTKPPLRQCQEQLQNLSASHLAHLPANSAAQNTQADSRSAWCHGVNNGNMQQPNRDGCQILYITSRVKSIGKWNLQMKKR